MIVDEQMRMLIRSGLYADCRRIIAGIVGHEYALDWLKPYPKVEIAYYDCDSTCYESRTLQVLHQYVQSCGECYVLYLHTKGAHSQWVHNPRAVSSWRQVMGFWLVDEYRRCIALMKDHNLDTVGGNFADKCPDPGRRELFCEGRPHACHYSGNFWWATATYLRRLPLPGVYRQTEFPANHFHLRLRCENWLLSLMPDVRAGECFRYTNLHPYEVPLNLHDCRPGYFRLIKY